MQAIDRIALTLIALMSLAAAALCAATWQRRGAALATMSIAFAMTAAWWAVGTILAPQGPAGSLAAIAQLLLVPMIAGVLIAWEPRVLGHRAWGRVAGIAILLASLAGTAAALGFAPLTLLAEGPVALSLTLGSIISLGFAWARRGPSPELLTRLSISQFADAAAALGFGALLVADSLRLVPLATSLATTDRIMAILYAAPLALWAAGSLVCVGIFALGRRRSATLLGPLAGCAAAFVATADRFPLLLSDLFLILIFGLAFTGLAASGWTLAGRRPGATGRPVAEAPRAPGLVVSPPPEEPPLLVTRAVERTVADPRAGGPRERSPEAMRPAPSAQGQTQKATVADPDHSSRYQIERRLGTGGFGQAFLATDTRLKRPVVLKRPFLSNPLDPDEARRWMQEALVAARIRHPNVVTILDAEIIDGVPTIVFEFVDGGNLAMRVEKGPIDGRLARGIGLQILLGLEAIHAAGIVHRDLKPANILLTAGPPTIAKVTDFGVARAPADLQDGRPADPLMSGRLGTLPYMSPEQLARGHIDARSDLYAAAAVIYEMTTGSPLVPRNLDVGAIERRTFTIEPSLNAAPAELRAFLVRGLAKTPSARFQTATEMRVALSRI
ncbi:MAG: serine/threonine-protein kinase [Thermoplasmatota archaeon]